MQPAHVTALRDGIAQKIAGLTVVDAAHQRAHQHHAEPRIFAGIHGGLLQLKAVASAQHAVHRIGHAIELQVHGIQSCGAELFRVSVFPSEAQTVGVDLNEGKAALLGHADDVGKIVAFRRFAAGKLHVAGTRGAGQHVELPTYFPKRRIFGSCPRAGIAYGTAERAAHGDFDEARAGMLNVFRAEAAVEGAAFVHGRCGTGGIGRNARALAPLCKRRCAFALLPCRNPEFAVFRAGFAKIHRIAFETIVRVQKTQADGTEALSLGKKHVSSLRFQGRRIRRCPAACSSIPKAGRRKAPWEACRLRERACPLRRQVRWRRFRSPCRRRPSPFP